MSIRPPSADTAPRELLGQQLASIASSLTHASKRRDKEVEQRGTRQSSRTPTPTPPYPASAPLVDYPPSSPPAEDVVSEVDPDPGPTSQSNDASVGLLSCGEPLAEGETELASPLQASLCGGQVPHVDNAKRLLAGSEESSLVPKPPSPQNEDEDDLELLRAKFMRVFDLSSEDKTPPGDVAALKLPPRLRLAAEIEPLESVEQPETISDPDCLPYVIALQLERGECLWEQAQMWTHYLFSDASRGYAAVQERETFVNRALRELDRVSDLVLKEEAMYRAIEEKASLSCRLVITNIAADANEEELANVFREFKFEIRRLRFLNERDPLRRTRTAHIDMFTKAAARQASCTTRAIFGLMPHVRLAEEDSR